MVMFEAAIYNVKVKAARERGALHPKIDDTWARVHFIEVDAMNEHKAQAKLSRQYQADDGFVIDELNLA